MTTRDEIAAPAGGGFAMTKWGILYANKGVIMPGDRLQRVAEEIRKEVAQILQTELKDPRVGGFVTITHVRVTPDLRQATVYFSLMDSKKSVAEIEAGLQSARGFVRKLIGERIRIKFNPEIFFRHDPSLAESIRISKLLGSFKPVESPPKSENE